MKSPTAILKIALQLFPSQDERLLLPFPRLFNESL